jgi:crossover junction endodeoxyribonuclease RuvC
LQENNNSTLDKQIILGIDPGSRKMGYGVIEVKSNKLVYRECGIITCDTKQPMENRLAELGNGLEQIIEEYKPFRAAMESVFTAFNPKSALILGQARGMALYILGKHNIPVSSYAPTSIKKNIVGRGRANKNQVRKAVMFLAKLNYEPAEDASDALAIAFCDALHLRYGVK